MSEGWVASQVNDRLTEISQGQQKMIEEFRGSMVPAGTVDAGAHERMVAKARTDAWISGAQTMKAIMCGIIGAAADFAQYSDEIDISWFLDALHERVKDVLLPDAPQ